MAEKGTQKAGREIGDDMLQGQNRQLKEMKAHGSGEFKCAVYHALTEKEGFRVFPHWHEEIEILYLKKGDFHLEINMEHWEAREEGFYFVNAGELHRLRAAGPCEEYAIVFAPEILESQCHDAGQIQIVWPLINHRLTLPRSIGPQSPVFAQVRREYVQMLGFLEQESGRGAGFLVETSQDAATQLCIRGGLQKILALLYAHSLLGVEQETNERIERVKSVLYYIQGHYREKLSLEILAGVVNVNQQYFCRMFKKAVGRPPLEYVREYRIRKAAELLEHTDMQVMAVCLESGFHNLGNFLREFKKQMGLTPLQYRKKLGDKS